MLRIMQGTGTTETIQSIQKEKKSLVFKARSSFAYLKNRAKGQYRHNVVNEEQRVQNTVREEAKGQITQTLSRRDVIYT